MSISRVHHHHITMAYEKKVLKKWAAEWISSLIHLSRSEIPGAGCFRWPSWYTRIFEKCDWTRWTNWTYSWLTSSVCLCCLYFVVSWIGTRSRGRGWVGVGPILFNANNVKLTDGHWIKWPGMNESKRATKPVWSILMTGGAHFLLSKGIRQKTKLPS